MEAAQPCAAATDARFAQITHAVMDAVKDRRLAPAEAYAYAVLHRRREYGSNVCRAPQALLADDVGCTVRQLRRYLDRLAAWGFVRIYHHRGAVSEVLLVESRLAFGPQLLRTPVSDPPAATQDTGVPPPRTPVSAPEPRPRTPVSAPPRTPVSALTKSTYQEVSADTDFQELKEGHAPRGRRATAPRRRRSAARRCARCSRCGGPVAHP